MTKLFLLTSGMETLIFVIISVLLVVLSFIGGYFFRVKQYEKSLKDTKQKFENIVNDGLKEAEKLKKDYLQEGKNEILSLKKEAEIEFKEKKDLILSLESKLNQREDSLERRSSNVDRREQILEGKELKLEERNKELDNLIDSAEKTLKMQEDKLNEIANLSVEDARKIIMNDVKEKMDNEIIAYMKEEEEKAKAEAHVKAKNILALAIQKYASDTTSERTVSVVNLPSDEMKGRIIGREGRNIRTIESLTGVDLIVDDTPEAVVLSGFDPIRREIAKRTLESLVNDGRIHPGRIEEIVERSRAEVEMFIREKGEEAVFTLGIGKMHPDLVKLLGRLNFRTSYGQNVLKHSIETAFLTGKLAAEIGEDEILARRAGLLHDIGKAVDHEIEGSHVEIGAKLAQKYREPKEVIDGILSHHGDQEPETVIGVLVAAADALSAARPGARSESLENYIKRLEQLEEISNQVKGVDKTYAIQAGREIRVIVKPEQVDDNQTFKIARQIKDEIESKLSYPGTIKITVIRETRAVDIAK